MNKLLFVYTVALRTTKNVCKLINPIIQKRIEDFVISKKKLLDNILRQEAARVSASVVQRVYQCHFPLA